MSEDLFLKAHQSAQAVVAEARAEAMIHRNQHIADRVTERANEEAKLERMRLERERLIEEEQKAAEPAEESSEEVSEEEVSEETADLSPEENA